MNDIELIPVRYGKWIFSGMLHHVCSVCEQISGGKYNYCPHCGAKMSGGK